MELKRYNYRKVDNKHANVSVKIVVPAGCNARCSFCFNKQQKETKTIDPTGFYHNVRRTLHRMILMLKGQERDDISLDITGNETTFHPEVLAYTMAAVEPFKSVVKRVVLTTNGFRMDECEKFLNSRNVDIVNFSVHHYLIEERRRIFGIKDVLAYTDYMRIIEKLKKKGIKTTAVAVINEELKEGFLPFLTEFVAWAKRMGFDMVRLRSCFDRQDDFIVDYFKNTDLGVETQVSDVAGLYTKTAIIDGLEVKMLLGVNDLTNYVVGIEAVIDDDGLAYVDYNKRYPLEENLWVYENVYLKAEG